MPLQVDRITTNSLVLNGAELCNISTPVFENFPFVIQPVLTRSCTNVKDTSSGNFGLNLEGWKINGSVSLNGDTQYIIYLGTIIWKNGNLLGGPFIHWKTTGSVTAFSFPDIITNPLSSISIGFDDGSNTPIYIDTIFVNFTAPDNDDLLIDVVLFVNQSVLDPNPLVGNIDALISFELEYLFPKGENLKFEFNPIVPPII